MTESTSPFRRGFTLIEVLVVITVIVVLIGVLMPSIALVRTKAKQGYARQTLSEMRIAFDLQRAEDQRKRYPEVRSDRGIHRDLLELLDDRRLWSRGDRQLDGDGLLLDPWNQPYRYSLTRPSPSRNGDALAAWNWDPQQGREARWGQKRDPSSGATIEGPLPYPYLWSIGRRGSDADARTWIISEDGP